MDLTRFVRAEWDRLAGYGFVLTGAVALVFGFVGVRTAADVIDEISYLVTGGIGAIFLLGVGATLLLSADLHDDFRKLHRVEEKLDRIHRALAERHPDLVVDVRPTAANGPGGNGATAVPAPAPAANLGPAPASAAPGLLAVRRSRRLVLMAGIGAAGLFGAGALATANQASTDHIAGGIGVALSGAMLVAVAAGVMLGGLKGRLERQMIAAVGPWLGDGGAASRSTDAAAGEVWVVDGLTLYHRTGCRALDGRRAAPRDRSSLAAGTQPCGLCEPDDRG